MNRLLLILGSLVLLALTTALVAPRFIDWSQYTDIIEEQASRLVGREVHVSGAVDLQFLPMPRLTFSNVEIASRSDGRAPEFTVERMDVLMSLAPFLSGEAHIVELTLDTPVIRLSALSDGRETSRTEGFDLSAVSLDDASIVNGRVERVTSDGEVQVLVEALNASLSAPSLLGPWRIDPASGIVGGERVSLRVNTGAYGGDRRMRMRVAALPANRPIEIVVDGHLDWSDADARFEGRGQAGSIAIPAAAAPDVVPDAVSALSWQVSGDLVAALDRIEAEAIELTLDQGLDQAFVLDGRAHVTLGEGAAFSAEVSSRQLDLDRMLGGGATAPISLAAGWQAGGALVRWLDRMPMPGDVSFDIPAIVVGGSVIREIGFHATYRPGLPLSLTDLRAVLPGDTALGFNGTVAAIGPIAGRDLALEGLLALESTAPGLFVQWSTGRGDEGLALSQLTRFEMSGQLVAQPDETSLDALRGTIDGETFSGAIRYRTLPGLGRHLDLDLQAGRFDFGLLSGIGRWLTESDVDSADDNAGRLVDRLNADLAIGELVAGPESLGEVAVSVAATPERVRINELAIGDAAGASVTANGFIDRGAFPPLGRVALSADMERLGGLVRLARDVAGDHPLLMDLTRNARLYEPVFVSATYGHSAEDGLAIALNGTLGRTAVELTGSMPPLANQGVLPDGLGGLFDRAADLRLVARADDAFALVGQLGVPSLPTELAGEGSFVASLSSTGDALPVVRLAFDGLETALRLDGTLRGDAETGVTGFDGTGSLFAGDVAQLGLMAGMALPGLFDPISTTATFDVAYDRSGDVAELTRIGGTLAEVPITGTGRVARNALGTDVDLSLTADRIDARQLLAGFVGPSALDLGFSPRWPEGPIAFNPLPVDLTLDLTTPRLTVWDDLTVLDGALVVDAADGVVAVDSLTGSLHGGALDARLVLRDADPGAIAEGRFQLDGLSLAPIAWERGGLPVMRGEGSARLSFESSGGSVTSLMAGLTGEGTLALRDVTISGLGLEGFARVLQASDAGLLGEDADLEAAFADALGAGTMRIDEADSPVTVVGGVAQLRNLYLPGGETALRGSLSVDLSTTDTDADFSYAATDGPGDVAAMPNVGLSFEGPLASPSRQLDVAQVASFLNVRQLEREIQRVEALNAEIIERERLLRIMGAIDLDRARLEADRIERQRVEAERLEQEELERQQREQERLEEERLEEERRAAEAAAEAERARLEAERQEAERLAAEQEARDVEARAAAEDAAARRAEEEAAARERALREALQARETPALELPPLEGPFVIESDPLQTINPLTLGEQPPAATSAPLDLSPN